MPITQVKSPDGNIIKVKHPEGASQDAILSYAKQQYTSQRQAQTEQPVDTVQPMQQPVNEQPMQPVQGVGDGDNNAGKERSALGRVNDYLSDLGKKLEDSPLGAFKRGVTGGLSFNLVDEAANATGAGLVTVGDLMLSKLGIKEPSNKTFTDRFNEAQTRSDERLRRDQELNPIASTTGEIAGVIGTGVGAAGTKLGGKLLSKIGSGGFINRGLKGATAGATAESIAGLGQGESGDRLSNAAERGLTGAVFGGASNVATPFIIKGGKYVGEKVKNIFSKPRETAITTEAIDNITSKSNVITKNTDNNLTDIIKNNPDKFNEDTISSLDDLIATKDAVKNKSRTLYKQAEQSQAIVKDDKVIEFMYSLDDILPKGDIAKKAFEKSTTKKAFDEVTELLDAGKLNIEGYEAISKRLNQYIDKETLPTGKLSQDGKYINDIKTKFDDMFKSLKPDDIEGGENGYKVFKEAGEFFRRSRNIESIEKIIEKSLLTDNPHISLRTRLSSFITNPKHSKFLNNNEIEAIKDAIEKSDLEEVLRSMGSRLGVIIESKISGGLNTAFATAAREKATDIQLGKTFKATEILKEGGTNYKKTLIPQETVSKTSGGASIGSGSVINNNQENMGLTARTNNISPETNARVSKFLSKSDSISKKSIDSRVKDFLNRKPITQEIKPQSNNSFVDKVIQAESGGNPNAKNTMGTASGLFGFTDKTFKSLVEKHGKKIGVNFADKNNPIAQRKMFEKLTQENQEIFERLVGRKPSDGEKYIQHFMGASKGVRLVKLADKKPNLIAKNIFSKEARYNPSIFYKDREGKKYSNPRTILEVTELLKNKVKET